ncbi:MAG: DUF4398 domain-containing protein, partial [Deltaproteobacteria bacterium]
MKTVAKVLVVLFLFASIGCGHRPRPSDLVKADNLFRNQAEVKRAKEAAPAIYKKAMRYYRLAEEAYEDGEDEECLHYSMMASITFSTAIEQAKKLEAEKRQVAAEKRAQQARKMIHEQQARLGDYQKRIKRMEQILALQKQLEQQKAKSKAEKERIAREMEKARQEAEAAKRAAAERLAAERAKAEQLKKEKEAAEAMAVARSKIQMAESLDAGRYDSMNMNSARTYLKQA